MQESLRTDHFMKELCDLNLSRPLFLSILLYYPLSISTSLVNMAVVHALDDYYLAITLLITIAYQLFFFSIAYTLQFDKLTGKFPSNLPPPPFQLDLIAFRFRRRNQFCGIINHHVRASFALYHSALGPEVRID